MNNKPERESHPVAWTLALIVAIPVIYVLTAPWVAILLIKSGVNLNTSTVWKTYAWPLTQLENGRPFRDPFLWYVHWCGQLTHTNFD